jgi:MarR family transcriptional regulator, organic hydroperoxide resistance regulator
MPDSLSPERIYFRFIRLHQRVFGEMGQTLKPTGLSIPQFDVLSTLTEQEGEAGLVERRSAAGDRRSNAVFLTDAGRKAADEGIRLQKAFVADTLGKLQQSDLKVLDGILTQWRDAVRSRVGKR